ncbi:hypothetical protein ACFV94_29745 [Streptomyces sp. NPDC059896]|uniref:hypothetical protein n=1 Tax=Streptomyces sp. NPDC059896 TaxID=3346993 RepID=UPI0036651A8D
MAEGDDGRVGTPVVVAAVGRWRQPSQLPRDHAGEPRPEVALRRVEQHLAVHPLGRREAVGHEVRTCQQPPPRPTAPGVVTQQLFDQACVVQVENPQCRCTRGQLGR